MNNNSVLLLILGIYSGFLSTFPIGPYKLLSIRKYLINTKNNYNILAYQELALSSFIASITGLLMAQIIMMLSIYNSSLYAIWMKPHLLTLISIPMLFFYWNKVKNLELDVFSESLEKSYISNVRLQLTFFESFFLQLLNPISLPNGVFSRLPGVFLFRYSNLLSFVFGTIVGFLTGYIIFFFSTILLVKRLENDTPTIYRLVKRVIHQSTVSIFFAMCLLSLGRTPIPSIKNFSFYQKSWQDRPWPEIFFNSNTWIRPMRLLKNNQHNFRDENLRAFNKMYFSEFFFETCRNNDKNELIHNYPHYISYICKDISTLSENSSNSSDELNNLWIQYKQNRLNEIYKNIDNRLLFLKQEDINLDHIIQKKISSLNKNNYIFNKIYDPRLNTNLIGRKNEFFNKSPLLRTNNDLLKISSYFSVGESNSLILNIKNKLNSYLILNIENTKNIPTVFWKNSIKEKMKTSKTLNENIIDSQLPIQEDKFSIEYLEDIKNKRNLSWKNLFSKINISLKQSTNSSKRKIDQDLVKLESFEEKMINMYKSYPSWDPQIKTTDLETPEPYEAMSVLANFVRHLLPGSIRARRRKALSWKASQNRPHAPIFLHGIDSLNLDKHLILFRNKENVYVNNEDQNIGQSPNILKSRWDFQVAHLCRGIALFGQAYIRRYIRLPILIICKNLSRQLLAQTTEWQQDWQDLSQEIYVDCDYDGNDLSVGLKFTAITDTPKGKQVKILRPFRLIYSKTSLKNKNSIDSPIFYQDNISNYTLDNYSYLTIWGDETIEPFGKIKKQPHFWSLILQRIKLIIRYKFINKFINFFTKISWINQLILDVIKRFFVIQKNIWNIFYDNSETTNNSKYNLKRLMTEENIAKQSKIDQTFLVKNNENSSNSYNKKLEELQIQNQQNSKIINNYKINRIKDLKQNKIIINNETDLKQILKNRKNRIHKYSLQHLSIYIKRYLFGIKKLIAKKVHLVVYYQKIALQNIKTNFFTKQKHIVRFIKVCMFSVRKYIFNIINSFLKMLNLCIFELQNINNRTNNKIILNPNEKILDFYNLNNNRNFSQATILHEIWQDSMINNLDINNIFPNWNRENILNKETQLKLTKKGLLQNLNPEDLDYLSFQEWLQNVNGYRPSLKMWQYIIPQYWRKEVEDQWKKSSNYQAIYTDEKNAFNYGIYHKPLFNRLEKFGKISQINFVIKKYTNFINKSNNKINNFVDSENLVKVQKNKVDNRLTKIANKNVLSTEIDDQYLRFDLVKTPLLKKLPIIKKKILRTKGETEFLQIKNRLTYPPIYKNKWKFNDLKNRFRNLLKIAKQRIVIKESFFSKKHQIDIPYSMRKDLNMFYQNFEPEDVFFLNILENWRYKILDDELLTHNMISSYLRFLNKSKSYINTNIQNSMNTKISQKDLINTLVPENFLLPENIYELRILETLNDKEYKNHEYIKKENQISCHKKNMNINETGSMIRFLWPSHRIEDLAYINRYWLATSNQSKFSLLRIRTFPINS